MSDPIDPNAGTPGPAEAPTEPVPVASSEPVAPPPQPSEQVAPQTYQPPPQPTYQPLAAPPPTGFSPPGSQPGYAPPSHWEAPSRPQPGPAPGWVYVGFWRRVAATLIDGFLFSFVYGFLVVVFLLQVDDSVWRVFLDIDPVTHRPVATSAEILRATGALIGLYLGLIALLWLLHFLYLVVFWSWRGGTLGQLALGIQVRRESDGRRIGIGTAILRYIGYLISSWVFCLGFIWAAFDRRKQGWHDKIAGTLVIRRAD
jgi:uncharacterized RDD family membrane protein YckC